VSEAARETMVPSMNNSGIQMGGSRMVPVTISPATPTHQHFKP